MKPGILTRLKLLRPTRRRAAAAPPRPPGRSRRGARVALLWCAAAVVALHAGMFAAVADPRVRDPEYGFRLVRVRDRVAENPGRPLVVVLGSSRVETGLRPGAWEEARPADPARPDPLLFNMALVGAGPQLELVTLNRLLAHGVRPAVVLLEYWPPHMLSEWEWEETARLAPGRLMDCDRRLVRAYFTDPDATELEMDRRRRNPVFADRDRFVQLLPRRLGLRPAVASGWSVLDPWGWVKGLEASQMDRSEPSWSERQTRTGEWFGRLFAAHRVSPNADRAIREVVELARGHGAAVGLVYFPESDWLRRRYPTRVEWTTGVHLSALRRDLGVPVIDGREWVADDLLPDGYHLTPTGAAEFTRRFGPAVASAFPDLPARGNR